MAQVLLDTVYYSDWFRSLGYDPDAIVNQIETIPVVDRSLPWMKYRGHELKRSKFFFVDLTSDLKVPIYSYPGFQYRTVLQEYHLIQDHPMIAGIQTLIKQRFGHDTNHVIGTVYYNQTDNIGWHDDKPATIDTTVPIYIFSFGQQRPLSIRPKPTLTVKDPSILCQVPMEHGSLCVLGHQTNQVCQHAILPVGCPVGKRVSLIFRKIANLVPLSEIRKKVKVA